MFAFFGLKRSLKSGSNLRRALPRLEQLETRYCPTGPTITSLSATVLANKMVSVTGTVTDTNSSSIVLNFSGVLSGTANADANGHFSYTTQGSNLGTLYAVATDGQNLNSNTVQTQVSTAAPYISFSVTYGSRRTVTLSGTVTDVDAGSLTVTFTGMVTGTTTTNADGSFSYTATATGLGNVHATTVDLWGQQSNTATVTLAAAAPTITNFQASQGPNGWTFTGRVTDQTPAGLTITFGGLTELINQTTTVQSDGTFSFTIQLAAWDYGTATAKTTDWWGLDSDTVSVYVPPG
jgi:hypothetical protein